VRCSPSRSHSNSCCLFLSCLVSSQLVIHFLSRSFSSRHVSSSRRLVLPVLFCLVSFLTCLVRRAPSRSRSCCPSCLDSITLVSILLITSRRLVLAVLSRLSCRSRSRPCCLFLSCLDSTRLNHFFLSSCLDHVSSRVSSRLVSRLVLISRLILVVFSWLSCLISSLFSRLSCVALVLLLVLAASCCLVWSRLNHFFLSSRLDHVSS
jgi:hypothetical protein